VPAVFLAVHTPEFLGIDQTIWIILATVVTGAATLMLAFLAVMTIAQGRKDRAFSAAPVLIIESGLSEQISIHSGAEESLTTLYSFPVRISNWGSGPAFRCMYGSYGRWSLLQEDGTHSPFDCYWISSTFSLNAGESIQVTSSNQRGGIVEKLVPADRLQGHLGTVELVECRDRVRRRYAFFRHCEDEPLNRRLPGTLRATLQLRWLKLRYSSLLWWRKKRQ
jgi:hypothetical protein